MATGRVMVALLLLLGGCSGDDGASGGTGGSSGAPGSDGSTSGSGGSGGSGASDGSSGGSAATTGGGTSGGPACASYPPGDWNACKDGPLIMNSKCGWSATPEQPGAVLCVSPASSVGSVCSIDMCEDACDCFAPPATGDAVVTCAAVLQGGGTACVLSCGGGETCPDGMECMSGTCFWPG